MISTPLMGALAAALFVLAARFVGAFFGRILIREPFRVWSMNPPTIERQLIVAGVSFVAIVVAFVAVFAYIGVALWVSWQ